MGDSRSRRFDEGLGSMVNWAEPAEFNFTDEVDALETLQELGDELRQAREHVRQVTRYLQAAAIAARDQAEATPTAIINHSGLARQTVYTMLGDARE